MIKERIRSVAISSTTLIFFFLEFKILIFKRKRKPYLMINYNNNLIDLYLCRSKIDTEKLRRRIASSSVRPSVHPSISRRRRPAGDTMDRKTWCTNFNLRRLFRAGPAAVSHLLLRPPPPPAAAALRRRTSALSAASGRKRRRRSPAQLVTSR